MSNKSGIQPARPARKNPASLWVLWLLPLVFAIHDAEELLGWEGWMVAHQGQLSQLAQANEFALAILRSISANTSQASYAIGAVALVVVAVTFGAYGSAMRGFWLYAYATLLGGMFLHIFLHIGQALLIGGYIPGLVGAIIPMMPGCLYIYKRLFEMKVLTFKTSVVPALAGIALMIPVVILAHQVGRLFGGS